MAETHTRSVQSCDFVILTAQDRELVSLLHLMDQVEEERSSEAVLYHVQILARDVAGGQRLAGVVAPTGGIGRVEAAVTASRLLQIFTPPLLFLIGIAGGFSTNGISLGDLIVASRIVDYEEQRLGDSSQEFRLKVFEADELLLEASRVTRAKDWLGSLRYPDGWYPKIHIGSILSGDKIIASDRVVASFLRQDPSVLGVEMEGAGVATAASRATKLVRFLMIRGVVDLANDRKRLDSQVWLDRTCEAVASFTVATLLQIYGNTRGRSGFARSGT